MHFLYNISEVIGLDYNIIRSNRKSISIEITKEASVIVRAPLFATDKMIASLVAKKQAWIDEHLEIIRSKPPQPELSKEQVYAYISAAKTVLPEKVRYFAKLMGVTPTGITITSAKKRFGSCSGKDRICFSYHLMRYPEPAIDYVVVHELAHIVHKNHSKDFYALVEKYMPDYKQREKLLKEPPRVGN